jgi:iron(III) transport system ATP-binding protein
MSSLRIQNVSKDFANFRAVDNVSLEVPQGAFLVLLGPSGCGKTTMLRMLAGLEHPTGGSIHFGDKVVADATTGKLLEPGKRGVGLVFQSYALWPHMTVRGNVDWPLQVAGWKADKRKARVEEVLSFLGISNLANRYPAAISGGQQQRVAIARTLAPNPSVILFDEPLSNLDAKLRVDMRAELLRIHRASCATSVYVTHDQVEAMTMATHVVIMNGGKVEQFGPPRQVLNCPASAFVATFVGTPPGNLITPEVKNNRYLFGTKDLGQAQPNAKELLYRAEDIRVHLHPSEKSLAGEFVEATPMAGRFVVTSYCNGQRLTATADNLPELRLGETVYLSFPDKPYASFNAEGQRLT